MSELPDMISAVVQDNKIDAESHFKNTMAQKIGSALDLKRVEVANSLVQSQPEPEPVETTTDEKV
jgi:hypothetical protein